MGWYLRKSLRMGPLRFNLSKRGVGVSAGVKGLRVGTGPRGPYVAGGRDGIYFRQRLGVSHQQSVVTRSAMSRPGPVYPPTGYPGAPGSLNLNTGAPPPPSRTPFDSRHYPAWLLISTIVAYIAFLITIGTVPQVAVPLLFAVLAVVLVRDWRGFVSLNDRIHWQRMNWAARIGLGYFYFGGFEFSLGIYLGFLVYDWLKARQELRLSEPVVRKRRIAELEAQLGMMPRTEGVCRACQKPLQAGAEWCAYCGAPVVARPRVCPHCAATALPDARFCPQCRAPLPPLAPPAGGTHA